MKGFIENVGLSISTIYFKIGLKRTENWTSIFKVQSSKSLFYRRIISEIILK